MPILFLIGLGVPANPDVVVPTDEELLDLVYGTRGATFRYDLLDAANRPVGSLEVDTTEGVPTITNNINRTIKRTMAGLVLPPAQRADINPFVHRVKPWMVLTNGSEFPLGIFLFADLGGEVFSFGDFGHGEMVDQGLILDQPSPTGAGYAAGTTVADAIEAEFTKAGLTTWSIDPTISAVIGAAVAWPAGTNRSVICAELCALGGAYSPYFDNDGTITVRRVHDIATATPELVYYTDLRSRVFSNSITVSNDALDAPNQYVVIDGSAAESPIVGVYNIPAEAPHSFQERGFYVTQVIRADGLESVAAANARAKDAYGTGGGAAFEHVTFSSPPDPRHDTFQVVAYNDVNYSEQDWTMPLREGADMVHHLRRAYLPTTAGTEA